MILLLKLIVAHFIGDFFLQSKAWVQEKGIRKAKSLKLYWHFLIHGALVLLFVWDWNYWPLALCILLLHAIVDLLKLYAQKENTKTNWFFIDQGFHIISIIFLWIIWVQPIFDISLWVADKTVWIYGAALLLLTSVSGILIQMMLANWSNSLNEANDSSLKNAGKYIGILERLFVFTFVIIGHWEAIGFLITAKSVFRFGDLKEAKSRKLTEYILIGTLLSFGIAILSGLVVLELLNTF